MGTKKDEKVSKRYVDESVDAQRQYTEQLFSRAVDRVKAQVIDTIEVRLKAALETIRPEPAPAKVTLKVANLKALAELKDGFRSLAQHYMDVSGLEVSDACFSYNVSGDLIETTVHIQKGA